MSLPRNDVELARAAIEGGADALKVHLNVHHHASGTLFRTWREERDVIRRIVSQANVPVGIVPGAQTMASDEELSEIAAAGIDFWDAFVHHALPRMLERNDLGCMMAVNFQFPLERAALVGQLGARVIEASIVPPDEYTSPLTAHDLVSYRVLAEHAAPTPIVIPSQRRYLPRDVPHLQRAGARGIVIGAVVTGHDAHSLRDATRAFRTEIDRMSLGRAVPPLDTSPRVEVA